MEISITDPATGEQFRSNPCRDVAFFLPKLMEDVCKRVGYLAKQRGLDEQKAEEAVRKFSLFFANACQAPIKTPFEAMAQTGFFAVDPEYRAIVYEAQATSSLGAYWAGVRSATLQGEMPISVIELQRHATEFLNTYCLSEQRKETEQ